MAHNKKNFAIGLVATAPTPALSGTSLILYPGQGADMPAVPFYLTAAPQGVLTKLDTAEVIEVTDVTTDTLTIVRAQKGTTAKSIDIDWLVANGIYTEDLDEYELLLPETPENPSTKYLNGNREWSDIVLGGGGAGISLYLSNVDSATSGYKKLDYSPDVAETTKTIIANNNTVQGEKYLFDNAISVSTINSGNWLFDFMRSVSSSVSVSTFSVRVFMYETSGTETTLFTLTSDEINDTSLTKVPQEVTQGVYTCNTTDRLGIQISFTTDRALDTTFSYIIGDGDAAYITDPLALRHSQLRNINEDTNNVHVSTTEKSAITHTNRTALDLVQNTNTGDQVADGITITGAGTELDPFVGVGSNQLITDETPTGLVNGANLNYTAAYAYTPGTMQVYINGVKQVRGTHFTEVGPAYTIFTMSEAPLTGDVISVNYQTTISTSGNADTVDGFNASSTPSANTLLPLNDDAKINNNLIYNPYMFSAYANAAQNTAGGTRSSRVALNAELFDISSNYDSVTNSRFVAPIDGFYYFNGGVQMGNALSTSWNAQLFKNGIGVINGSSASAITFSISTVSGDIQLNAGDYVELHIFSSSAVAINPVAPSTYFQGHLISAS